MKNTDSILSDIQDSKIEAPHIQRWLANVIDFIIEVTVGLCIYIIVPKDIILQLIASDYLRLLLIFLI
ncbi:MAG TPA: hypothetical protein VL946_00680, partial [Lacibacter sp.]|nr:hypothetical protein [Lacibacter sp.]